MAEASRPGSVGMEGDGAYNRDAKFQADGSKIALLYLQEAAEKTEIDQGTGPVIIADYGSLQGKNSLGLR